jgi:hypothetical protein
MTTRPRFAKSYSFLHATGRIFATTCFLLGAALPAVFAQGVNSGVYPPGNAVSGLTYGQWSAAWWQWLLAIPTGPGTDQNPQDDTTGQFCNTNQSGPVWYLAGSGTGAPTSRVCSFSSAKAIFFPLINVECSTLDAAPFNCTDEASCRKCVTKIVDGIDPRSLSMSVDGAPALHGVQAFRVLSPFFDFTVPSQNILGVPAGSGMSVSDGYWIMLKPLSPGHHTIHFTGAFVRGLGTGFSEDVTYGVDVTP